MDPLNNAGLEIEKYLIGYETLILFQNNMTATVRLSCVPHFSYKTNTIMHANVATPGKKVKRGVNSSPAFLQLTHIHIL